tara:strand:+ start:11741 stop:12313 length:573 start_codon:yes stop_codon:yes gene_type:complete
MELHGKVVSPNRTGLNLNGAPEILVNTKSGRITLTPATISKLDVADLAIGFGYDPAQEQGAKAFMYVLAEGCKVGKGGTVSSKWHASALKDAFNAEESVVADTTRFKLDINLEAPVDFSGTTLYPLTFQAALANLTRTKKVEAAAEPVLNCPAHEIASQELEEKAAADIIEFEADVVSGDIIEPVEIVAG